MRGHGAELLQLLIAAPDDVEIALVYADELQALGDPRGELIAAQHALMEARGAAETAPLRARTQALLRRHAATLLGPLDTGAIHLDWHLGFIRRARLMTDADALRALLAHPSARLLRELVVELPPGAVPSLLQALESAPEPCLIERLSIGTDEPLDPTALGQIQRRLPRLRQVWVRGMRALMLPRHALLRMGSIGFRHPEELVAVAATASGDVVGLGTEGRLETFDGLTGVPCGAIGAERVGWRAPPRLALHHRWPGGPRVVHTTPTGRLLDAVSGDPLGRPRLLGSPSPDGAWVAGPGPDGCALMLAGARGEPWQLCAGRSQLSALAWAPLGDRLASGHGDGAVRLWSLPAGQLVALRLGAHRRRIRALAFSPDGETLASGGSDRVVRTWSLPALAPGLALEGHTKGVRQVLFAPDGRRLVSNGTDRRIRIWDLAPASPSPRGRELRAGSRPIAHVALTPDGRTLLGAVDRRVRRWRVETGAPLEVVGHDAPLLDLAWSPDGRTLATVDGDQICQLWGLDGTRLPARRRAQRIAFAPDGRLFLATQRTIEIWAARRRLARFERRIWGHCLALATCPEGERLFRRWGERIDTYDASTAAPLASTTSRGLVLDPGGRCVGLARSRRAVSADGRLAAWWRGREIDVSVAGGPARVLPVQRAGDLSGQEGRTLAFSPSAALLAAAGGEGGGVHVLDPEQGRLLGTLWGHTEAVTCLAFSPSGRRLATGSRDTTTLIWDIDHALQSWPAASARVPPIPRQ